jgi:hypothetical protein
MNVDHDGGSANVADLAALDAVLNVRNPEGFNGFFIYGSDKYPTLAILVREDIAHVTFFPGNDHPGHVAIGNLDHDRLARFMEGDSVIFWAVENFWIAPEHVIPFENARRAAHDFFASQTLSPSLDWFEL